jgi:hypothetical protein
MLLQKINYFNDSKKLVVCAVDTTRNGEFTLCANNLMEAAKLEDDDWDIIGNNFEGKLKNVTCPNCLRLINFIKNME